MALDGSLPSSSIPLLSSDPFFSRCVLFSQKSESDNQPLDRWPPRRRRPLINESCQSCR